ncbi:unnamed protein product [Linum trigynum]|uniref:Uncharacterized protein n=1 Tax=Linum trigynum TaxID=586398 RepID=A0AAV2D7S2_9ROSI
MIQTIKRLAKREKQTQHRETDKSPGTNTKPTKLDLLQTSELSYSGSGSPPDLSNLLLRGFQLRPSPKKRDENSQRREDTEGEREREQPER